MNRLPLALIGLGACASTTPIFAQTNQATAQEHAPGDAEDGDILVIGGRPEGSVVGDATPEVTFTARDIRSFGVSSIADLIAELAPQTTSGQGRGGESPVVLLNGKRVSSFAEIRDIPTEAIQRVEVLPEEVALKYGYRPNQKVVNVVLRRRFKAFTGELEGAMPTAGGQFSPELDTGLFHIMGPSRLTATLKYQRSSALYENERDITPQTPRQPFDITGNITSTVAGNPIDPALTALLGRPATVIGVPSSAANGRPSLADFASGTVNQSDLGAYRTLLPQTDALTANVVLARTLFDNVAASFNGTLTLNQSDSAQGLATTQGPGNAQLILPGGSPFSPFAADTYLYRYLEELGPLGQKSRDITGHLGATFSGSLSGWQWTLTGNYDHGFSRTDTDRGFDLSGFKSRIAALDPSLNPFAPISEDLITGQLIDRARSTSDVGSAELVVSGSPFSLPAGTVTTSIELGGTLSGLNTRSVRSGVVASADLSRDLFQGQFSIDVPLTSRKNNVLAALGDLSVNFNAGHEGYSDVGGLNSIGAGLNWKPIKPISFIASLNKEEGAPTMQQLGNPLVSTTGVRVFDYIRGETTEITRVSGGNPLLSADNRRVIKLGVTLKPLAKEDLTITANYTNSRIKDPIASFPTATAAIEGAFPDRFTRDANDRLLQIDSRPINFARQNSEEFRWGINFSKQLSSPPPPAGGARGQQQQQPSLRELLPPGQTQNNNPPSSTSQANTGERPGGPAGPGQGGGGPGAGPGGGRFPGGGFGRGGGGRGTRLQLAVYHTVHLQEQIRVYDGGPVLDLLDGDAIGSGGGQARHEVQAQAGLTHNGLGSRLSFSWQSGTTVNGGLNGTQPLRFSDLATLNLRLFANLGQQQKLVTKMPFLRGSRVTLSITNLFDAHQNVRDATGVTPISYQPDYLDPLGRSIRISFRKLFF
jgi:hypothetical protein